MCNAVKSNSPLTLSEIEQRTANVLGNTPAVARNSYIHSDLIALWKSGEFADYYSQVKNSKRKNYFSQDEVELQSLLLILFEEKMAYLTK